LIHGLATQLTVATRFQFSVDLLLDPVNAPFRSNLRMLSIATTKK
jgi:hypothetical protein